MGVLNDRVTRAVNVIKISAVPGWPKPHGKGNPNKMWPMEKENPIKCGQGRAEQGLGGDRADFT